MAQNSAGNQNIYKDNPPLVYLKRELVKFQHKSEDQFRDIQRYLDSKNIKFTTIHYKHQRHKKICIRGIPPGTEPQLIIDELALYGFAATMADMLKNRKKVG